MISIQELIRLRLAKLSFFLSLMIGGLLLVLAVSFEAYNLQKASDDQLESLQKSFKYWSLVGDQFQMKRAIENISAGSSSDFLIYQISDELNLAPTHLKDSNTLTSKKLTFFQNELYLVTNKSIVLTSDKEGKLILYKNFSIIHYLAFFVISFLLINLLTKIILKRVKKVVDELINPIESLVEKMNLQDFSMNELELEKIKEYKVLKTKIKLQQNELLEMQDTKTKQEIALQVAHDIKSPLSVLEIVLEEKMRKDDKDFKLVQMSLDRIKDITDNLFEIGKMNLEHDIRLINVSEELENVLLEKRAEYAHVHISKENTDSAFIYSEKGQFQRLVSNLINNSIEAGADEISLSMKQDNGKLNLVVSDNGKGIPSEIQHKVFEKNFTSGKKSGTGTGLYHAKTMIEKWNGDLSLLSSSEGTQISMAFPMVH